MFAILNLIIGVVSFSFAVGSLSTILSSLDTKNAKLKEKLMVLNEIRQGKFFINRTFFYRLLNPLWGIQKVKACFKVWSLEELIRLNWLFK